MSSAQPKGTEAIATRVEGLVNMRVDTCERVGAQILSLGAAFGGLAGGFEGAGAAAQEEEKRPGPRLWHGWPRGRAREHACRDGGGEGPHLVRVRVRTRVRVGVSNPKPKPKPKPQPKPNPNEGAHHGVQPVTELAHLLRVGVRVRVAERLASPRRRTEKHAAAPNPPRP